VGLLPGITLYVLFGIFAAFGGISLWYLFLHLDSVRYPIRMYGDIGQRVYGTWCRHLFSLLQSIQLVLNVGKSDSALVTSSVQSVHVQNTDARLEENTGLICLSNGQGLAQIINGAPGGRTLCFSVCVVIWALVGMVSGQIRTLKVSPLSAYRSEKFTH